MKRSAIKIDLFTSVHHRKKIDQLGWSTTWHRGPISTFQHSHQRSILVVPHPVNAQGGRPPYPTEAMVRILVLKRLHNLSDEQMEYQLLGSDELPALLWTRRCDKYPRIAPLSGNLSSVLVKAEPSPYSMVHPLSYWKKDSLHVEGRSSMPHWYPAPK